jgi:hypothetical protein
MVEYGPLSGLNGFLKSQNLGQISFTSVTGLPYWLLAVVLAGGTLAAAFWKWNKTGIGAAMPLLSPEARSWKPWVAGLLIGILGGAAYLSSAASGRNYPLGVSHGVVYAQLLVTDHNLDFVYQPAESSQSGQAAPPAAGKQVSVWLICLILSLIAGSWLSVKLSGQARLIAKPPEQLIVGFAGSLMVGAGAALATGCVIGNILSGISLMSVGMVFFAVVVIASNWATTYLYLMGGSREILHRA